ncbi:TraM recognition domain-containing protein [Microcoleus sp. herbarium8]|uniref:type IV secretory system conjugative DNA transfer family protein n=1 Tax=Microcoleus sp. herbarium8 TaxID=3055436 RepID=UPI002FD58867
MKWLKSILGGTRRKEIERQPTSEKSPSNHSPSAEAWGLDSNLYGFGTVIGGEKMYAHWTVGMSYEGLQVFGGTGSGKTSGTGKAISLAMLRRGYGGLVLCAKADEAANWRRLTEAAGRAEDLVIFSPETGGAFNFLDYEMERSAGGSEAVIAVLMQLSELGGGGSSGGGGDDVWDKAGRQLLRNALDLLRLAGEPVRLKTIYEICTKPEVVPPLIAKAQARVLNSRSVALRDDLQSVSSFLEGEWVTRAEVTRASVLMNLTSIFDPFLRGAMRDCFCGETNIRPDDSENGKIIVIDMSIKEYNELGRYAAVIWKFLFQRFAERRGAGSHSRPLFIYADESQFFVTSADADFQTTARSSRCATVYLTQNLPNYFNAVGGSQRSKYAIDSLLGNLQTKIWHQNGDKETNEWAASTIGRDLVKRHGTSSNLSFGQQGGGGAGSSSSEQMDFIIQPREFTALAKGGASSSFVVTAILYQSGRIFGDRPSLTVAFNQKSQ